MSENKIRLDYYNTMAIGFMAQGRYTDAIRALRVALLTLQATAGGEDNKTCCVQPQTQTSSIGYGAGGVGRPTGTGTATCNTLFSTSPSLSSPLMTRTTNCGGGGGIQSVRLMSYEHASSISPNNLFMLYSSAFTVHPHWIQAISNGRWMTILLFNLGLATQLNCLIQQQQNYKDITTLHHVLDIYRNVMQAIYSQWDEGQWHQRRLESADEGAPWILMALACNAGHIHSHLLDFASTRENLSLLLHLASQSFARSVIPPEDYQLFFDTVCIFMDGMDLTIAPAA